MIREEIIKGIKALNYVLKKLDLTIKEDIDRYLNKITLDF